MVSVRALDILSAPGGIHDPPTQMRSNHGYDGCRNSNDQPEELMSKFSFWQKWLFTVSILIIVFGLGMAFLNRTPIFYTLFDRQINLSFWNTGIFLPGVNEFQGWVYGVLGSTMAGWGIFFAFIAHIPFRRKERWAWNCMLIGLSVWYIADTVISLYYRVYFNAVFNTLILILVILPLIFTYKFFTGSSNNLNN